MDNNVKVKYAEQIRKVFKVAWFEDKGDISLIQHHPEYRSSSEFEAFTQPSLWVKYC